MQIVQNAMLRAMAWAQVRKMEADEDGQTMVEYALIIALVSVALIVALGTLAGGIQHIFEGIGNKLSGITVT